jgi:hypothetical protein
MINVKEENKNKQSDNLKEEKANESLDTQRQQLKNTTSTILESTGTTTNKINDNINEYQKTNRAILEKSIDTSKNYQQETFNTIQSISNRYFELQNNILNTYQSTFSRYLDDVSKSNWNNFRFPERYSDIYNKTNQNVTDPAINCTQRLNDFALTYTENFNKSIDIAQRYYNESVQNYFDFVNKITRYSNQ